MIKAILVDALAEREEGETASRGGFTDVGLHTGGLPRSTAWPLVRAVLQAVLEDAGHDLLHRHLMAQLKLWLAEAGARNLYGLGSSGSGELACAHRRRVDSCMQMLRAAVLEGAALADEQTHFRAGPDYKHAVEAFEARCVLVRWQIEKAVAQRAAALASKHRLPQLSKPELPCRNPTLSLPTLRMPAQCLDGLGAARTKAEGNLGWLPAPPTPMITLSQQPSLYGFSFQQLGQWLNEPRLQPGMGDAAALLALETVERAFFARSGELENLACWSSEPDEASAKALALALESIVDRYRLVAHAFMSSTSARALLSVERYSRELLVVWCAFCFVHKVTLPFEFKVLKDFGVALQPDDLRHLVLSQKPAVDAAQHVCAYLRKHKSGLDVFSLRPSDATFEMARLHSSRSKETQALWETEKREAAGRQEQHWQAVQKKQAELRTLDSELASLEAKRDQALRSRNSWNEPSRDTSHCNDREWRDYNDEYSKYTGRVAQKSAEIRSTEKPPAPIYQPLPEDEAAARVILFFLTMPPLFQVTPQSDTELRHMK